MMQRDLIVIGAGPMGLAAAYHALRAGHRVTLLEASSVAGGMAAHFDFSGISVERFYHFVCKADAPLFDLMKDLGIAEKMMWRNTSMGYFVDGKMYPWGDPVSLLTFPKMSLWEKLRYGLLAFISTKRSAWSKLDRLTSREWIEKWVGRRVYDLLWRPLFALKFFEYADNISAAWVWTRLKRVGTSRKSLFQEELGYIDGGSETLVNALVAKIVQLGGKIILNAPVAEILTESNGVSGARVGDTLYCADRVISTVPTPFIAAMVPSLSDELRAAYSNIRNIGVVCVLFRLRKSVTPHFWVNISDRRIEVPGIIQFSNLRTLPNHLVYIPYYMPQTHPKFGKPDDFFTAEGLRYLQMINPEVGAGDIVATHVGRLRYAQPVCPPEFLRSLPEIMTPIEGLQIADTCYYYPEDRGISESVRLAKLMASRI